MSSSHIIDSGARSYLEPEIAACMLPVRFSANLRLHRKEGTEATKAVVFLDHQQAIIRHHLADIPLTLCVPVRLFSGIAVRVRPNMNNTAYHGVVELQHKDPALNLPLFSSDNMGAVSHHWKQWAQRLHLPLLIEDSNGTLRSVSTLNLSGPQLLPAPRRKAHGLTVRRPRFLTRRRIGDQSRTCMIYRDLRKLTGTGAPQHQAEDLQR